MATSTYCGNAVAETSPPQPPLPSSFRQPYAWTGPSTSTCSHPTGTATARPSTCIWTYAMTTTSEAGPRGDVAGRREAAGRKRRGRAWQMKMAPHPGVNDYCAVSGGGRQKWLQKKGPSTRGERDSAPGVRLIRCVFVITCKYTM